MAGDRFIPRRGDSADGDQKAWLLAESSCSISIDKEAGRASSILNLSMADPEQRKERRRDHKNNVMAVMIDRKAVKAQSKFTALARNPERTAEHGMQLPMRNLNLTQRQRSGSNQGANRGHSEESLDSIEEVEPIRGIQ